MLISLLYRSSKENECIYENTQPTSECGNSDSDGIYNKIKQYR